MSLRATKQRYVSIIQLHTKSKALTPDQGKQLEEMVHRCHTEPELAQVKLAVWNVLGNAPADNFARLLDEDPFEPGDPPALQEALIRARVNVRAV